MKQGLSLILCMLLAMTVQAQELKLPAVELCRYYDLKQLDQLREQLLQDTLLLPSCTEVHYMTTLVETADTRFTETFIDILFDLQHSEEHEALLQRLDRLFDEVQGKVSLMDRGKRAQYRDGHWQVDTVVEQNLLYLFDDKDWQRVLRQVFRDYHDELERVLEPDSFLLYALLFDDAAIDPERLRQWQGGFSVKTPYMDKQHYRLDTLLDVLIYLDRYDLVERYQSVLTANYDANPFHAAFLRHSPHIPSGRKLLAAFRKLTRMGFAFHRYTREYDAYHLAQDNLALMLIYDPALEEKTWAGLIRTLAQGRETCDTACINYYVELSIQYSEWYATDTLRMLMTELPYSGEYSREQVSNYILACAIHSDRDKMQFLFDNHRFDLGYLDPKDPRTGLNAMSYAKQHRDREMVAMLDEQGFKSQFWVSARRNLNDSAHSVSEVFNGIFYVIGIATEGYSN